MVFFDDDIVCVGVGTDWVSVLGAVKSRKRTRGNGEGNEKTRSEEESETCALCFVSHWG